MRGGLNIAFFMLRKIFIILTDENGVVQLIYYSSQNIIDWPTVFQ